MTPTQLTGNYYAVTVPEGAEKPFFDGRQSIGFWLDGELRFIHLTSGSWQLIGTTKKVTEAQAKEIVEEVKLRGHLRYEDYTREFMWHETAVDSLTSLLASKGLEPGKVVVVRKT
jgi:hypothetical protein